MNKLYSILVAAMVVMLVSLSVFAGGDEEEDKEWLEAYFKKCNSSPLMVKTCLRAIEPIMTPSTEFVSVNRVCDFEEALDMLSIEIIDPEFVPEDFPVPEDCIDGERVTVELMTPHHFSSRHYATTEEVMTNVPEGYKHADWTILLPLFAEYLSKRNTTALGSVFLYSRNRYPDNPYETTFKVKDIALDNNKGFKRGLELIFLGPTCVFGYNSRLAMVKDPDFKPADNKTEMPKNNFKSKVMKMQIDL